MNADRAVPPGLDYAAVTPESIDNDIQLIKYIPVATIEQARPNDVVTFQMMGQGFLDPYSTYLKINVEVVDQQQVGIFEPFDPKKFNFLAPMPAMMHENFFFRNQYPVSTAKMASADDWERRLSYQTRGEDGRPFAIPLYKRHLFTKYVRNTVAIPPVGAATGLNSINTAYIPPYNSTGYVDVTGLAPPARTTRLSDSEPTGFTGYPNSGFVTLTYVTGFSSLPGTGRTGTAT